MHPYVKSALLSEEGEVAAAAALNASGVNYWDMGYSKFDGRDEGFK